MKNVLIVQSIYVIVFDHTGQARHGPNYLKAMLIYMLYRGICLHCWFIHVVCFVTVFKMKDVAELAIKVEYDPFDF